MKAFFLIIFALCYLCLNLNPAALAKRADIEASKIKLEIEYNGKKNTLSYQGFYARVNAKEDEFFSHEYFLSLNDLKSFASKFKTYFYFDALAGKLSLGDTVYTLIPVNPKLISSESGFMSKKVQSLKIKGKTYLKLWDLYSGMGFHSISKTSEGYYIYRSADQ